ncbi:MAG: hypothetical protein BGO67_09035 [Alphaproteobacteria bacterium 41-28]|nr:MAG: hypothetical protein BGO67_09035 [Alphaproteobacteria bacterium 41-28]
MAPRKKPLLLVAYERYIKITTRPKKRNLFQNFYHYIKNLVSSKRSKIEQVIVATRSKTLVIIVSLLILFLLLVMGLFGKLFRFVSVVFVAPCRSVTQKTISTFLSQIEKITTNPKDDLKILEFFKIMRKQEAKLINNLIKARKDITAWYCPAAFWPDFNDIKAPRLMCIPDVVLANFPISFACAGTGRMLDSFKQVEKSIEEGEYFVTYSEEIKWGTLSKRYHIDPEKIFVVPHGNNSLNEVIKLSGSLSDNEAALIAFSHTQLKTALCKSAYGMNGGLFMGVSNFKFIFYASQFRPNKNIISLLKAYDYLLKRRYIPHRLILTGLPSILPSINEYIQTHGLENDVLCLHGLSTQELAACYKLADLAVNPSLSEGGCPFTFTEALSVDTPVVMSRIPVTLEVIKDPDLDKEMFFDPYDWKDMADRIEWALQNKEALLAKQKLFYNVLEKRTWKTVVDEYIDILEHISNRDLDKIELKDAA